MASNIEVASYDPKKVNLVMNGKIITGFASDSMITIARNEDTVTTQVGVRAMWHTTKMQMRAAPSLLR